jgi:topoisomerase-4 subunit B
LLEALREFCEFRNLLPRGIKLAPGRFVGSLRVCAVIEVGGPHNFLVKPKSVLSSREAAAFVSGVAKDAFSLWLNQHIEDAEKLAQFCISNAGKTLTRRQKRSSARKITSGPALPGKLADCSGSDVTRGELFLVEGGFSRAARLNRRAIASIRPSCRCAEKF